MSADAFPSNPPNETHLTGDALSRIRVRGGIGLVTKADAGVTRLADLHEFGGYRVKHPTPRGAAMDALIVNTGGGVAGGDSVAFDVTAGTGSALNLSTVTAERVYRALSSPTQIGIRLRAERGAFLVWNPQATILFSGSNLIRRLDADVAGDARLLIAECTVFGRPGSGDVMTNGSYSDHWRIRRGGRLVFADSSRLEGVISDRLERTAVAGGQTVAGLVVFVAPEAEEMRTALRELLDDATIDAGVSAWNGMAVARILSSRLDHVQNAVARVVARLTMTDLPASWHH